MPASADKRALEEVVAAFGKVPEEVENLADPLTVEYHTRPTLEERQEAEKNPQPKPVEEKAPEPEGDLYVQMYQITIDGIACASNNPANFYGGMLKGQVSEIDLKLGEVDIEWQISTGALRPLGLKKIPGKPKVEVPTPTSAIPPIPINREQDAS